MFKLLYNNCTHFTFYQGNAQNSSSQVSAVYEPRTSKRASWIQKRQKNKRSNCQYLLDHRERYEILENHLIYFTDYAKAFNCVDHNKLWKILKDMGIPSQFTCLMRILFAGQEVIQPDIEQWTDSKLGKEYNKAVYCHPSYLTYMQSTSCEIPGWMTHKLESRLPGENQ